MNDFQSVFSSRMLLLINDWSTAGHDFSSLKRSLLSFDEYCLSNDVDNEKLTKDLVCGSRRDSWDETRRKRASEQMKETWRRRKD